MEAFLFVEWCWLEQALKMMIVVRSWFDDASVVRRDGFAGKCDGAQYYELTLA